jgi:hypothetical protein
MRASAVYSVAVRSRIRPRRPGLHPGHDPVAMQRLIHEGEEDMEGSERGSQSVRSVAFGSDIRVRRSG